MPLQPIDSLEILAIVDNELDPISPAPPIVRPPGQTGPGFGTIPQIAFSKGRQVTDRGNVDAPLGVKELAMEQICCAAHGLSLMLTATKDGKKETLLFDTGPTESIFEANAKRLSPPLQEVSRVHLSHWHRDHSGGMLKAISLIQSAKSANPADATTSKELTVDLHPSRPEFRGGRVPIGVMSLEADPQFSEIEGLGAVVEKNDSPHEVLNDYFLVSGEIPRVTEYEQGMKFGVRFEGGEWVPDELIMDERFVLCHVKEKGLVLFTGCSHAGVVNCARHATSLVPNVPLYAIVGGYHLADAEPEKIASTIRDLKALDVKALIAGHCTGWRAKFEIEKEMPGALVPSFVGTKTVI